MVVESAIGVTVDASLASHLHSNHFTGHNKAELPSPTHTYTPCAPQTRGGFHPLQHPLSPAPCPAQPGTGSLRVNSSRTKLVLSCRHTQRDKLLPPPGRTSPPLLFWAGASPFLHLSLPRPFATEVLREEGSDS